VLMVKLNGTGNAATVLFALVSLVCRSKLDVAMTRRD